MTLIIIQSRIIISPAIKDNHIAGNQASGIYLRGGGTWGNTIQKNIIGVNKFNTARPNGNHGIGIYDGAHDNIVGSLTDVLQANMIYENNWSGIAIVNDANYNTEANNLILRNDNYGVDIVNSTDNLVIENEIASNGDDGVGGKGILAIHNTISQNSIYQNKTGIFLENNANQDIAPPNILDADCDLVNGTACPNCHVEIFSDEGAQGKIYEDRQQLMLLAHLAFQ